MPIASKTPWQFLYLEIYLIEQTGRETPQNNLNLVQVLNRIYELTVKSAHSKRGRICTHWMEA